MWCRFSLPGSKSLRVGAYYKPDEGNNESLQELLYSLEMVSMNTLDLVVTNNETRVVRSTVVPGISDHDCPVVEFVLDPVHKKQKPREISLS